MNIFYFDDCPVESAYAQPDKMLVKMPLETAQMLCTAHRELDGDEYADAVGLYKRAYWNHPCTIWARESSGNYMWLHRHFLALGREYTYRYGKIHSCEKTILHAEKIFPFQYLGSVADKTWEFARAMPDQWKYDDTIDTPTAYKLYIASKPWVKDNYLRKPERKPDWI